MPKLHWPILHALEGIVVSQGDVGRVCRWCVFTSAGDYSNVCSWIPADGRKRWDLVVAFYGDSDSECARLAAVADMLFRSRGSKFQNLRSIFLQKPEMFLEYDYIWVADDDLLLIPGDIDRLFELASRYDFWVCQPAFSPQGRVSHQLTYKGGVHVRITNFVEMTCPVFRTDKLLEFLKIYDGVLVGWGIDWWYCNVFDVSRNRKAAVIDEIVMTNPHAHQRRGGKREIESLQPNSVREAHWKETASRLQLKQYEFRNLAQVSETERQVLLRWIIRARFRLRTLLSRFGI
jgi:hypothetical protein